MLQQREWMALQRWYRGPLGRLFAEAESAPLQEALALLFGYHVVALGAPTEQDPLAGSRIAHRCRLDSAPPLPGIALDLLADPAHLPIAGDCVDAVVLPHLLECVSEPDTILREVERILIPEGHVLIIGFNPFSLWGLWRLVRARRGDMSWGARFLSVTRLRERLAGLGMETVDVRYCFYRPPLAPASFLRPLVFLERMGARWWPSWGGGYLLVAKKRVSTLTPVRPRWRAHAGVLAGGVPGRTSRNCQDDP